MRPQYSLPLIVSAVCVPLLAQAHVSIKSGPTFGTVTDVVVFGVGHGCHKDEVNLDTTSVTIEIPEGVTSVRPELSGFDRVDLETDKTGAVTAVTWTKDQAQEGDTAYYELRVRVKAPDVPFTLLEFPAHQTCAAPDGSMETVVDWVGYDGEEDVEPGPSVPVLPPRFPGWNKFTAEKEIKDLASFFGDAQIVWQGDSAFSPNPTTVELIAETEGVSSLAKIKADKEFWVKY